LTAERSPARVRDHFRRRASWFDALYDEERLLQRRLRPGLLRRRDFALEVVRSYPAPSVLDVGCGSGRVGELTLRAGAAEYLGVDFSEPMLELARSRLAPFGERARLVHGDFRTVPLEGRFEVVLALGLFDYLPDPDAFLRRMGEVCSGTVVGSFPRWSWGKGPIRKLRYQVVRGVRIYEYGEADLQRLFADAGFSRIEIVRPSRSGYLVRARP